MSRGLGDVYKRQRLCFLAYRKIVLTVLFTFLPRLFSSSQRLPVLLTCMTQTRTSPAMQSSTSGPGGSWNSEAEEQTLHTWQSTSKMETFQTSHTHTHTSTEANQRDPSRQWLPIDGHWKACQTKSKPEAHRSASLQKKHKQRAHRPEEGRNNEQIRHKTPTIWTRWHANLHLTVAAAGVQAGNKQLFQCFRMGGSKTLTAISDIHCIPQTKN